MSLFSATEGSERGQPASSELSFFGVRYRHVYSVQCPTTRCQLGLTRHIQLSHLGRA